MTEQETILILLWALALAGLSALADYCKYKRDREERS